MFKKLTVSALGLVLVAPAFSAVDISYAVTGMQSRLTDVTLIGGALVACYLVVFPLRFIAKLFRG
jgi:Inovirus Coat protein B